jgi:2'-5' RNA ligase
MNIGFALIPNRIFLDKLIQFQRDINQKYNFTPSLSLENNLPHITILQGTFADSFDYDVVALLLSKKLEQGNNTLFFSEIIVKGLGWFFLLCRKDPWLQELHEYACNLLQEQMIVTEAVQTADDLAYLTPIEKHHHLTYGYRYMKDAYLPHITLGRYIAEDKENVHLYCQRLWREYALSTSQHIERLTVYEMGNQGAHAKTLWEYNL